MQVKNNAYGPNLPLNADGKKFKWAAFPFCVESIAQSTQ